MDLNAGAIEAVAASVASAEVVNPVGTRTQWETGNEPLAGVEISAPTGIGSYEPDDLTVVVGAGTSFAELDTVLAEHGQECPLDPRDQTATIGGIVASGLSGIRRRRHGPLRDHVLEVRFVTADGRLVKGGGPTVKNVTGYDLPRLFVGSFGTLGVIVQLILRCRPRPAHARWFRADEPPDLFRAASTLWDGHHVWTLLEGSETDVGAQSAALDPSEPPALPTGDHRGRISVPPGALVSVGAALDAVPGARWFAELGIGTVHVAGDDAAVLAGARAVAHDHNGWMLREAGGADLDGFGRSLPNAPLMRRVKDAFDPHRKTRARPAPDMTGASSTGPFSTGPLSLDAEELVACVSCGLCLPHCPTYRVTGLEIASPRGRIAAMRLVELEGRPIDDAFATAMNECVQCRGCEVACPSSVQFGHLMEQTRARLHERVVATSRLRRVAEWIAYRLLLPVHALLLAVTWFAWAAQRVRLVPRRFGLPNLSARSLATPIDAPRGGQPTAWCFTGCVMDAWLRDTHRSTVRVMRAAGAEVARPGRGGDCCGALHMHAGREDEARRLARRVIESMPGEAPVVVNSAGCGAAMKDYGRLLDTAGARAFSTRVRDFSEWVAEQRPLPLRNTGEVLVVQDPCHLRHVQRAHGAVRTVLGPAYTLAETDDDGLCCGAGGAYAALQPELATSIRDRKAAALRRASPGAVVASANPGCMLHLGAAGLDVRHPADLLATALREDTDGR